MKDDVDEDETGMKRSVSGGSLLGDSWEITVFLYFSFCICIFV